MRNYIKTRAMYWTSENGDNLFAFGGDDEQLMFYVMRMESFYRVAEADPTLKFTRTEPQTIWFELNRETFLLLLNRSSTTAQDFWIATRLNTLGFTINTFPLDNLWGMTRVEVERSPRKTWSHGH